ncbi:MAG: hypothetical protein ACJ788_01600 [Ktedonobacteraceae bacterium]
MVQAHQKLPIIEIDDLQPDWSIKGFKASWKENGLVAYAYLMPLQDQPSRGYVLEYSYDSEKQPGRRLTDRQIDQGTTLVSRIRARMLDAMRWAGWQVVGKQETGRDIWQHSSRLVQDKPQELDTVTDQGKSRAITVPAGAGRQSTGYTRTITARDVTFTCSRCGQEVTKVQFPGPTPRYCDTCAKEVEREKTRARVARLRERQKVK